MRETVSVILMMVVLLTACGDFDQAGSQEVDKEIGPIVSEQVDSTQKGIEMPDTLYPTQVVRGDDGDCYYFRKIEEGDNKRIIFYKNNAEKVWNIGNCTI